MKTRPCYAAVLLLLQKRRFVALTRALNREARRVSQQRHTDEPFAAIQAAALRSGLLASFVWVASVVVAAVVSAIGLRTLFGAPNPACLRWLQYGGIGVLLWATLASVGWRIRSWGEVTLPEQVDRWLYRVLYLLGSYLLALSVAWQN